MLLNCHIGHFVLMCSWNRIFSLRLVRFQEHIRYIRSNNPQSAFSLHILQNRHEYSQMNNILSLLKLLNSQNMLMPFEQYYIQTLCREGKLIHEQYPGEINPLFQMVINPQPPHTTWINQLCFSWPPGYHPSWTALLKHTANQGMYNLRYTALMNTSRTSDYKSNKVSHYTQEYIMSNTYKRSQLLTSTETRC